MSKGYPIQTSCLPFALALLPTILPSFLIEKEGCLKMMELVLGTKNNSDIEYLFGLNRPQYLHLKTCLKKALSALQW